MTVIGMLRRKKKVSKNHQALANALVAQSKEIDFFYFNAKHINFEKKLITGYKYKDGNWRKGNFPFPDVVINDFPKGDPHLRTIYKKLGMEVPFTAHSEGNKMKVYKLLYEAGLFRDYLVPSEELTDVGQLFNWIEKYREIIVKPVKGNKGRDVFFMGNEGGDTISLIDYMEKKSVNERDLTFFINEKTDKEKYLVQKYINSRTPEGNPCDYRTVLQKNGEGKWVINFSFARISPGQGVNCSRSRGASIGEIDSVLNSIYGKMNGESIYDQMKKTSLDLARHMDELYSHPFDELAFDLGVDKEGRIWLYEVNTFPGTEFKELSRAMNMIPYAMFLAQKHTERRDADSAKHSNLV